MSRRTKICKKINKYIINKQVVTLTKNELQKTGEKNSEGLVFWAGWIDDSCNAFVTKCIVPKNTNWKLGIQVDFEIMNELMDMLIKEDLVLLAQVHSHPGDFGHSWGDDLNAASYQIGFISIVVPNWGFTFNPLECYFHEYEGSWRWSELSKNEIKGRFSFE